MQTIVAQELSLQQVGPASFTKSVTLVALIRTIPKIRRPLLTLSNPILTDCVAANHAVRDSSNQSLMSPGGGAVGQNKKKKEMAALLA